VLDRALTLDPNYSFASTNKGRALGGLGRCEEELIALGRALALDPSIAIAWNNKAISLRALGRTSEAEAAKKHASELGWTG
jgi:Flp pilus assembly protein TadD